MATAKKLPSGSWRVQVFDYKDSTGKNHYKSFTAKTKKEAEYLASSYKMQSSTDSITDIKLIDAMNEYLDLKQGILSSTTINGYRRYIKHYPESLLNKKIGNISKLQIDSFIRDYFKNHSAKSVHNLYGFLSSVCKYYGVDIGKHTLPQIQPRKYVVFTDDEIRTFLNEVKEKDHDLYVGILLGSFGGLRRSEICGASAEDITGTILHIHKTMLKKGAYQGWEIVERTKTASSNRYIDLPQFVIDELPKEGQLCPLTPDALTRRYERFRDMLGLPKARLHDTRHYFASMLIANNVPKKYIQDMGGWKSSRTMDAVYTNIMSDYEKHYSEIRKKAQEKVYKGE